MKSSWFPSLGAEDKQMARTTDPNLRVLAIVAAVALAACLLVLVDAKLVWAGPASFTAAPDVGVGDSPEAVVNADFNGDSKADLATANIFSDNVSVRLGNGDGTFTGTQTFSAGDGPLHLTSGNFNADTNADLAVANVYSDNVSVLLGNGNGTFVAAPNVAGVDGPFSVSSADFNGDSKADLAVDYSGFNCNFFTGFCGFDATGGVSVRLGIGDGTFGAPQNFTAGSQPTFVTSGNFNADTKVDLATANAGSDNVSVLLGKGDGTFETAQNFGAGDATWFVTSADFNGDSKADLATANAPSISFVPGTQGGAGNVSVLLGNGDGTFAGAKNFGAGTTPIYLASADFDGDTKVDLAAANNLSNNLSVLSGNGDGTFGTAQNFAAGTNPAAVVGALFNNDSKVDLAVANENSDNVSVLLNNTSTTPLETSITSGPDEGSSTTSNSATFGFSSNKEGSTFQCQLSKDGTVTQAWAACTSPKSYSNLTSGNYMFEVKATDSDGMVDQTPASRNWTITSPPETAPTVIPNGTVPTANATKVDRTTNVTATFSEDMMASSINSNTFKLYKKGSTTKISATVSYDPTTGTAKLNPFGSTTTRLARGATYKAVVTTGAKDLAGNSLDQDQDPSNGLQQKKWLFTTTP